MGTGGQFSSYFDLSPPELCCHTKVCISITSHYSVEAPEFIIRQPVPRDSLWTIDFWQ